MSHRGMILVNQDELCSAGYDEVSKLLNNMFNRGIKGFYKSFKGKLQISVIVPSGFINYRINPLFIGLTPEQLDSCSVKSIISEISYSVLEDKPFIFVNTSNIGVFKTIQKALKLGYDKKFLSTLLSNGYLKLESLNDYIDLCISLDRLTTDAEVC